MILFIFYILGCVLSYGIMFGYFQNRFPRSAEKDYVIDMIVCFQVSVASYITLLAFIATYYHDGTDDGPFWKYGLKFY